RWRNAATNLRCGQSLVIGEEGVQGGRGTGVRGLAPHGGGWPSGARCGPASRTGPLGGRKTKTSVTLESDLNLASRACLRRILCALRVIARGPDRLVVAVLTGHRRASEFRLAPALSSL